jgi:fumarylacetoacetate (FAA) hydrolase family protein
MRLEAAQILPDDAGRATLIARVETAVGPHVAAVRDGRLIDLTAATPTVTDLLNADDRLARARATGPDLGAVQDFLDGGLGRLLAPIDLSTIKASGVTFAASLLERVIEEQARGDAGRADAIRATLAQSIGTDLGRVVPGSPEALRLKQALIDRGAWSQYLEVGIGPDAEIFTKAPPMAAVGVGAEIGIHPSSTWNNPEPEIVLAVAANGATVGAMLGNDVNLRDVEGRSALLLGKAKDNNASCALGPFLRLFDEHFTIDTVRAADVDLTVAGPEGFAMRGRSSIARISRDPLDLVAQLIGPHHQYPDGVVLFLGTMFAPTEDRDAPGMGFTHKVGDVVTIASPALGRLVNRVTTSDKAPPWVFGARALMANLAGRGLL